MGISEIQRMQERVIHFPKDLHDELGLLWRAAPITLQAHKINNEKN